MMRALQVYEAKRNFKKTPEPAAIPKKSKSKSSIFVVQEHHASHLHFDFRLEVDGVLKSWAIPKGPSLDPTVKRLAVEVEDHPLAYAQFEGHIPEGEYGGGDVYIWDHGYWSSKGDPVEGLKKGRLEFSLKGKKLTGDWLLIRTHRARESKPNWLLIKRKDNAVLSSKSKSKELSKRQEKMPAFIEMQLAQLVEAPPQGEGWIHETKFDGYRTQARIENGEVHLLTRSAQNWTAKYPTVVRALEKLKIESAVFDGEVVWLDEKGRSDFQKLQNALKQKESSSIIYYVFDLLFLNGEDLRPLPLAQRKERLEKILSPLKGSAVLFSEHLQGEAEDFLQSACDLHLEGIVSKRADQPYISGRNDNWAKSKCKQRQEFVIGGYTQGTGSRVGFGALLLGVYEKGKLRYVGRVGTGFSHETLLTLKKKLKSLEQKKSPFDLKAPKEKGQHWVEPKLVAEIAFAHWTQDEILRVPVFQGLRADKSPKQILKEEPLPPPKEKSSSEIEITHPDRIIFKTEELTKLDVAEYYKAIGKWILPHIADRPLSLLRCPRGTSEECFYQKHFSGKASDSIELVSIKEKTATRDYMVIDSIQGISALVQNGAVEFHGWNCRKADVEHPDQIIFDFDPGPGIVWKALQKAALDMKKILDGAKLKSFIKVSGSKGLHIHVPIKTERSWEEVKAFSLKLAEQLVSKDPKIYTVTPVKASRNKKIYIDYLRNSKSATAIIPYSLRARETSSVALPISWEELADLRSANSFTMTEVLALVKSRKKDPWKDYWKSSQRIPL